MIYSFAITTPANTPEDSKQKTDIKLTSGIIHQLDIVFPAGCAGLMHIAVNNGLHQLWPTNSQEYFHTDGEAISFKEFYKLKEDQNMLTVYSYNIDDTYDHTVIFRLGVLKQSEIQGTWLPWSEEVIE